MIERNDNELTSNRALWATGGGLVRRGVNSGCLVQNQMIDKIASKVQLDYASWESNRQGQS